MNSFNYTDLDMVNFGRETFWIEKEKLLVR